LHLSLKATKAGKKAFKKSVAKAKAVTTPVVASKKTKKDLPF